MATGFPLTRCLGLAWDRAGVRSIECLPDCWLRPLRPRVLEQIFRIELKPSTPSQWVSDYAQNHRPGPTQASGPSGPENLHVNRF